MKTGPSTRFPPSSLLPFISASSDWEQGKACSLFSFYGNRADLWMTEWKDGLNFTVLGCQCAMYRRNVPHFYPNMLVILGEYSQRIEGSGREREIGREIGQGIERRIEFDISI